MPDLQLWHYGQMVTERSYWLDLFTLKTWEEFLSAGGEVSGFSEIRWKTVERMKQGDYLLCYLTGLSRWVGVLEVTTPAYRDESKIWSEKIFPSRVGVRVVVALTPETAVPVLSMRDSLSVFQDLKNPNRWTGPFRGSPAKWQESDGLAVLDAVIAAQHSPVIRPVPVGLLMRGPRGVQSSIGAVTVPDDDEARAGPEVLPQTPDDDTGDTRAHTEMQYYLLKLGSEMGLGVWVARNDKGRSWQGKSFAAIPRLLSHLPHQFDPATNRIIEMIDVLWLNGPAIVAAFEVESTTSVYSGLLRMSDLLALQPNINIPLFIVAPEERRAKVIAEINRPTFSRLDPPLVEVCQLITFDTLRSKVLELPDLLRYMRPEILQEFAESCAVDIQEV